MAASPDTVSMAMFCDFENVALGVRDAQYDKFDIKPVLERLLLKGSIVLKKAYCDWERYKAFKATMHEANFELIEIPHVRQSGKNSADIRMVVDALDLCYTKSHVNTFVIVSGDSDFSPLVSKLRENAKYVIGVGVKQSTSDLLIANCDEFIFYDDLVRESQRAAARKDPKTSHHPVRRSPEETEARRSQAIELALTTFEALVAERGDSGKIWASMLKEAIKRRKPDFNESYFGFRTFGLLLDEAQHRGLLELGRDEKSGTFVSRVTAAPVSPTEPVSASASGGETTDGLGGAPAPSAEDPAVKPVEAANGEPDAAAKKPGRGRGAGKSRTKTAAAKGKAARERVEERPEAPGAEPPVHEVAAPKPRDVGGAAVEAEKKPVRGKRARKPKALTSSEKHSEKAADKSLDKSSEKTTDKKPQKSA